MRRIGWSLMAIVLLVLLAGCGIGDQNQQAASAPGPTPTVTTPTDGPGIAIQIPNQPTATPTPTIPTPSPTPHPMSTRPPAPPASGGGSLPPVTSATGQLEQQLFNLINHDRAAQGLYAYVLNSTMSAGARQHDLQMANPSCGMSHQCPGEPDPCTRVTNEGIFWTSCGENVGYTGPNPTDWAGVQVIEQDMLNEQPPDDGHRLNLLNTSYHRVGIGIYIDSKGIVWITEDFAS